MQNIALTANPSCQKTKEKGNIIVENDIRQLKLNQAAYFLLKGARLLEVTGRYGDNRFTVQISPEVYEAITAQPLVDYKQYMRKRHDLKLKAEKVNHVVKYRKGDHNKQKIKKMFG